METDTNRDEDWRVLNGMADGELDPAQQAELAGRLSSEPDIIAGLRRVTALKAVLSQIGDAGAPPVPGFVVPRRPKVSLGRMAAAAVLLIALVLPLSRATAPSAFEEALASHRSFVALTAEADPIAPPVSRVGLPGAGIVPDLADAGLVVRYAATELLQGTEALHLGYYGSRGCRVSLWIRPGAGGFDAALASSDALAAAWTAGETAYLLFASGMSADRFSGIAEAAERATQDAGEMPEDSRLALRVGRAGSRPCVG